MVIYVTKSQSPPDPNRSVVAFVIGCLLYGDKRTLGFSNEAVVSIITRKNLVRLRKQQCCQASVSCLYLQGAYKYALTYSSTAATLSALSLSSDCPPGSPNSSSNIWMAACKARRPEQLHPIKYHAYFFGGEAKGRASGSPTKIPCPGSQTLFQ